MTVASRGFALATLLVCAAFAMASPSSTLSVLVMVPAVVAAITGARLAPARETEAIASFIALAVGAVLPRALAIDTSHMTGVLSDRTLFFVCPMLLLAGVRSAFFAPSYGHRGTVAVGLVALAGAGRANIGIAYPLIVAGFLLCSATTLAVLDPARGVPRQRRTRALLRALAATGIAGVVALAIGLALPALHARLVDRIMSRVEDRAGFSDQITLGDLHGMLLSKRVVLRVRNGSPRYLRGAVFSSYRNGGWATDDHDEAPIYRQGGHAPSDLAGFVEVEYAEKPERYFLPADATAVVVSTGSFFENRVGLRLPSREAGVAKRAWYRPLPNTDLSPPVPADREPNRTLSKRLDAILADWGIDQAMPARDRVDAIARELGRRYTYSLSYERTPRSDFVIDFLTTHKEGHCEYFASAFVLLARASGVPARVVTGFRVSEHSPLSDYAIVRERDAHSWGEVWLDGAWTTWDPTPASDFAGEPSKTPWASALWDLASTSWEKVDDFLSARSPFELTIALVGLVGLLVLVRIVRARRGGATRRPAEIVDAPLPAYLALERALAARGVSRLRDETLETFATRLDADTRVDIASGAPAVRAYAALRYGGRSDVQRVELVLGEATGALG